MSSVNPSGVSKALAGGPGLLDAGTGLKAGAASLASGQDLPVRPDFSGEVASGASTAGGCCKLKGTVATAADTGVSTGGVPSAGTSTEGSATSAGTAIGSMCVAEFDVECGVEDSTSTGTCCIRDCG